MKQSRLKAAKALRLLMLLWAFAMKWLPKRNVKQPKRILVMVFGGVGDAILMIPTLSLLREKCPDAHIALLASTASGAPTIFRAYPEFYDELITIPPTPASWSEAVAQNFRLMKKKFDCALISYISSYSISLLLPALCSAHMHWIVLVDRHPLRKVYERLFEHRVLLSWETERRSEILIHQEILRGIQPTHEPSDIEWKWRLEIPDSVRKRAVEWLKEHNLWDIPKSKPKPFAVVHLGASEIQNYKKVPIAKLVRAIEWFEEKGLNVIVVGAPNEANSLIELQKMVNRELIGCFQLDLLTVSAIIEYAKIVLSSDSGIGHLAILMGTPTVRIFGPSFYWGFRAWRKGVFIDIFRQIECAPCLRLGILNRKGLNAANCGHRECLNGIDESEVISVLQSILSS